MIFLPFCDSWIKPENNKKPDPLFLRIKLFSAGDRNRTGTGIATHGILSPGRLPVPPRRHNKLKTIKYTTVCNSIFHTIAYFYVFLIVMGPTGLEPVTLCL